VGSSQQDGLLRTAGGTGREPTLELLGEVLSNLHAGQQHQEQYQQQQKKNMTSSTQTEAPKLPQVSSTVPPADFASLLNLSFFAINLAGSTERWKAINKSAAAANVSLHRFNAVDLAAVASGAYDELIAQLGVNPRCLKREKTQIGNTNRTIACWLSHVLCYQQLSRELGPEEFVVVLEDDVRLKTGWRKSLGQLMQTAPADWTMLRLNSWGVQRPKDKATSKWYRPTEPFKTFSGNRETIYYGGAGAQLLRGRDIPRVIAYLTSQPIDDIDGRLMWNKEAPIYVLAGKEQPKLFPLNKALHTKSDREPPKPKADKAKPKSARNSTTPAWDQAGAKKRPGRRRDDDD